MGAQNAAYIQGITGTTIAGPTETVVVNSAGRLGTATAPKSDAGLRATVRRQQRQIERLRSEVRELAR